MMKNQALKNSAISLKLGATVVGKWNKEKYTIKARLGQGAIGSVYLAKRSDQKEVALKISDKTASISTEVNVLKSLAKVQGAPLGPYLFDVDDWISPSGDVYPFYVMEYVKGKAFRPFLNTRGDEWLGVLFSQVLTDLERLHESGWVFGDLKLDNLIVASSPPRLRWIDVGGTTQIGRSIKEYTEFYDRGYWQLGSRKAEPSYDLFALAMVALHYAYPKQFERGQAPEKILNDKLQKARCLIPYHSCLKKALQGRYQTSAQMKDDINKVLLQVQQHKVQKAPQPQQISKRQQKPINTKPSKKKQQFAWLEIVAVTLVAWLFWFVYLII